MKMRNVTLASSWIKMHLRFFFFLMFVLFHDFFYGISYES